MLNITLPDGNKLNFEKNVTGFEVAEKLKEMGILINGSYTDLRMVAHYGIDHKHIDKTIESMSKVMNSI